MSTKVPVIPSVGQDLETVPKNQEKRLDELTIRGRIEIIHITEVLKSRSVLEI